MGPQLPENIQNIPTFDPTFLNLDYVFYQVFRFFIVIIAFIARLLGFNIAPDSWVGQYMYIAGDVVTKKHSLVVADTILHTYTTIVSIVSIFLIAIILYSLVRLWEIQKENKAKADAEKVIVIDAPAQKTNARWELIKSHADSDNPNDWRLAIIEADTVLEEISRGWKTSGETLGERLKNLDLGDMRYRQDAWEAHKVRNNIAHAGLSYTIDRREAARVIGLYEKVFRESGEL